MEGCLEEARGSLAGNSLFESGKQLCLGTTKEPALEGMLRAGGWEKARLVQD